MPTVIANLWTPQIWVKLVREKAATFPVIFNSKAVAKSSEFDSLASGAGTSVNVPIFHDISDQDDEVQVENTAPTNDNGITAGVQNAPILNRVTQNSGTALAAAVSGSDPVGEMTAQIGLRRSKQRNKTLLAMLLGAFGSAGAAANGCIKDVLNDISTTGTVGSANLISTQAFLDAKALMGELADDLANGAIFLHPNILSKLEQLDAVSFKTVAPGLESGLPFTIRTYRGIPLFTSEGLLRYNSGGKKIYDTYIMSSGVIAYGEKAQTPDTGFTVDVAALQYFADKFANTEYIFDRTRFLFHLNGLKWVGTPAGQSASNSELTTSANWQLIYQTPNRVGIAAIRSNG